MIGATSTGLRNAFTLTWRSVLTRSYYLQETLDLNPTAWFDSGLGLIASDGATTSRMVVETNWPTRFYRVEAIRPLPSP